jgi:hypothetical protein
VKITQLRAALAAARISGPPTLPHPHPSSQPPLDVGRGQFAGTTSAPADDYDIDSGVASDDDDCSTVTALVPHGPSSLKVRPSHASASALNKQVLDRASNHEQLSVSLLATFVSHKHGFDFFGADFEVYNYRRSNAARRGQEMSSEISKSGQPTTAVTVGPWQSLGELDVFATEQTTLAISSPALHDHKALQTALMHISGLPSTPCQSLSSMRRWRYTRTWSGHLPTYAESSLSLSSDKSQGPCQQVVFNGTRLDSVAMSLRLINLFS